MAVKIAGQVGKRLAGVTGGIAEHVPQQAFRHRVAPESLANLQRIEDEPAGAKIVNRDEQSGPIAKRGADGLE